MAIKQPALIAARDNRKKKKENEILKAPTAKATVSKPKTVTVKSNDKGKTYVDRSTISKKPTTQNTPQNRVVTNKERLSGKSTFGGIKTDTRTIKTTKKSKPTKKYSSGTYDIYERDGKYYYNDGKEKQIDTKFVQNALKNNRKGVIGRYDSKGKLRETDENGNVRTFKGKTKDQLKEVGKQFGATIDHIKQGKIGLSQQITDSANLYDAVTELPVLKQMKIGARTAENALARWGHGAIKEAEGIVDWGASKFGVDVSDDSTQRIENWLGYTPEVRDKAEQDSLVTHDNFAGKAIEAGGGMGLDVMLGAGLGAGASALGKTGKLGKFGNLIGNPGALTSEETIKGLSGLSKVKAIGKNAGIDLLNKTIQQSPMILASGGRAYEEAQLSGATKEQASEYANKRMLLTFGISNMFNGIPGLKNDKGFLDRIVGGTIGKPIAKITEKIPSDKIANAINATFVTIEKGGGEALEENLEGIFTAMLKNATYSEGEKYTLKEAKEDALIAWILGSFFEVGDTVKEVELERNLNNRKKEINEMLSNNIKLRTGLDNVMNRILKRNGMNNLSNDANIDVLKQQLQQSEIAKQQQASEINQMVQSKTIEPEFGNFLLSQVKDGTYAQNRNLEQIATQQKAYLDSQLQQGLISDDQHTDEVRQLANTVNQTREEINTPEEIQEAQEIKEEKPKNVGKHYGDLGKANDTYYSEISKSRSTGHFGTGTYFVSENYEPGGSSSYAKRPKNEVSFDDYNLYKPTTDQDGYDLHDGLKAINSKDLFRKEEISEIQKQYNNYKENLSDESIDGLIDALEKSGYDVNDIKEDFEAGWSTRAESNLRDMAEDIIYDYDRLYKNYNKMIEQIKKNNPNINDDAINNAFEETNKALEKYKEKGYKYGQYPTPKIDSLSTIFMKNLGYEGIDVRHLKGLDDTTYGSVIYDLKNNEKETADVVKNAYKDIKNKNVKATIAPYYDTPLTKSNYRKIKGVVDESFRNTANNIATLLGGNIKETTNNIGGFTFEEGEKAGDWVKELSYTFELENMSKDDSILFTSLMGDLGYEQQEAVIAATYEDDINNSNAVEFRLNYKNREQLSKALDELGIHDYTIDIDNKQLKLLEFGDLNNPAETAKKIVDVIEKLGGDLSDAEYSGIQSEYITKGSRERTYKTWLEANKRSKENRELYSLVEEAYNKVKSSENDERLPSESLSNENQIEKSKGTSLTETENSAVDKQGNPIMAPFLQSNGGDGGNSGGNNNANLGKNPKPKKGSVEADILESYDQRIANKKKPVKEKISDVMHETTRALFDKGEEIDRIGRGHNDPILYPLYDLAQTTKASADFSINVDQVDLNGQRMGDGLNKVWEEVEKRGLVYQMNKYLYELHNIDRWNQFNKDGTRKYVFGPEHSDLVSRKNIAELLRVHPELEPLSKPILQYQRNLKQLLVDSGTLSQKQSEMLDDMYKNYVPTWRDKDNVGINAVSDYGGNISVNNQIKKATGSTENLLPLKEVQAQMTENIMKTARTNIFLQQLYKDIGDIDALKEIGMNSLKAETNIEPIDADAFYKAAEEHLDEYLRDFAPNNAKVEKVNGQPVATVWFNGQKVSMPIDKGIQVALEPVRVEGNIANILNTFNNFKRGVITQYNPIFAGTNAIKDVGDAAINSKFGALEYRIEYDKTIREMLSNKKMSKEDWTLFNQYLAMGGYSNTVFDKRTGFAKPSKGAGKLIDKIGDMNDFIEQIPRFTEFKLTLKHGGTLVEAMYNAAEVTTNFKRSGVLTKKMDKLATTFFSASTAGFYKQVRNLTQQPNGKAFARFATKALTLGLTPAIINGMLYSNPFGDDDDKDEAAKAYKNLPQYVKDDYLVYYVGDGKFLRIPRSRVASIPGIVYNASKNKAQKEEVTFEEVASSILNQVGPSNPLSSNAILQIWQSGLFDNESQGKSWNGSAIESYYLHKQEVTNRYDSKTDELSKAISKGLEKATKGKIQISPKKLSYTIDQNSGIIGDLALPWLTPKSTGSSTASRIANPVISKFSADTVVSNKTSNKFYDKLNKYSQKSGADTATIKDKVENSYLSSISGEISEKRKEIEKIESSKMSKDEKYKKTRAIQREINKLQEKGLKNEGTYEKDSKYTAKIGGEVYYKSTYDGKTTWKRESEKTKDKRESLGLTAKDYYYYQNDEAYTTPKGEKRTITYGKNAKMNMAIVDAFNFDTSDYLEYTYKINKIRTGNKITNQRKIYSYINSLPISGVQKAYLYRTRYKSYRTQNNQIVDQIRKSNLSKKEKEEMYSYLKLGR